MFRATELPYAAKRRSSRLELYTLWDFVKEGYGVPAAPRLRDEFVCVVRVNIILVSVGFYSSPSERRSLSTRPLFVSSQTAHALSHSRGLELYSLGMRAKREDERRWRARGVRGARNEENRTFRLLSRERERHTLSGPQSPIFS